LVLFGFDFGASIFIGTALTATSIALIGLDRNLIMQDTYAALALMSLLTTVIPPLILRNWLFKKSKSPKTKNADSVSVALP